MKKLFVTLAVCLSVISFSQVPADWGYNTVTISQKDPWYQNRFYVQASNPALCKYIKTEYKRTIRLIERRVGDNRIVTYRYYFDSAMYIPITEDVLNLAASLNIVVKTS
jgi:hypothetical protein